MSSNPAETSPLPSGISANALSSLFGAINGLRNRRALVAMMGCLVGGVLLAGLLAQMGAFMTFLAVLVWIVAVGTGVNAAGLLHMDDARGISPRSTVDALVHGLLCIPKLIALGVLLFLVQLAVFLVIAIARSSARSRSSGRCCSPWSSRSRWWSPASRCSGLFLCMLLSLPAIWQGATIMRALSQTLAIARSRIVEAILLLAVVWLLAGIVALIVFGVLFAGLLPTIGLSASIVGFGGLGSMMGGMGGMGGWVAWAAWAAVAAASAMRSPAGLGLAVLWAIAGSLVAQVYLLGLCLVYLRVTEGLDLSATEAALRQKLDEARSRASDLGEKARAAANRATAPTPPPPAAMQPPPYDPPAPVQSPFNPAGMAAGGAAAASFAAAPPPTAAPPAYTLALRVPSGDAAGDLDRHRPAVRRCPDAAAARGTELLRRPPIRRRPTCRRRPARCRAGHACRLDLPAVPFGGHRRRRVLRRLRLPPEVSRRRGPCLT